MPRFRPALSWANRAVWTHDLILPWTVSLADRTRILEIWSSVEAGGLLEDEEPEYSRLPEGIEREYLEARPQAEGEEWFLRVDVTGRGPLVRAGIQTRMRNLIEGRLCTIILHTCRHDLSSVVACAQTLRYSGIA